MRNKTRTSYNFSNLENTGNSYENLDTSVVDLTQKMILIIQNGDAREAGNFVRSEPYQAYLESLAMIPGYLEISYLYNCVAAYISALGVLSSYSAAQHLLDDLTHRGTLTSDQYKEAMAETVVAFTDLVEREKSQRAASVPVRRACAYIQDHVFSDKELDELASYCGYSLSYLRHRFRQEMGLTLGQYIQENKVNKAKYMLKNTGYSIARISSQLGFCSESYFISVFKRITGCTPRQYRDT